MEKSTIIIGGGLGGLFTGAILSREGIKVTVIEKNQTAGGGLQSFTRFGEVFDTGMHVIGGMQEGGNARRICDYLGITDKVKVVDVDDDVIDRIYFAEDKKYYSIAKGRENYVRTLAEAFPSQKENLQAYVDAIYRIASEVDMFHLKPPSGTIHSEEFSMPANCFIDKYITDERLKSVVAYMNPFYGGVRNVTPSYIHALISVLYIEGPSRFAGGSYRLADTLCEYISSRSGQVITGDPVVAVTTQGRKITGIRTSGGLCLSADNYVCAIHPCTFFTLLDDQSALPQAYRDRLNGISNSYSAFTVNLKLKKDSFRYINHSCYYMSGYGDVWDFGSRTGKWPLGFLYMTPPEIEQGEYATKMIITVPMLWEDVRKWEGTSPGRRGEQYGQWKSDCTRKVLDCMEELYPGFRSRCVEQVNTASPLTIRDYYGVKEGSMCGFSKDSSNLILSQVPVVTKIPNLFLTGQNCNLHGFCGVTLTAINTCEAILGRNHILDKLRFDDIRPYYDCEINAAMKRIVADAAFGKVAGYAFPDMDVNTISRKIAAIDNVYDFQMNIMFPALTNAVARTSEGVECSGIENIDGNQKYLFVSNHRDIVLDASILQILLAGLGMDTTEITFGANLMEGNFVVDIGKSNKMFKVERPGGNIVDFYKASMRLSDYIRTTLTRKGQSVWIANRNGRTKDGMDRTDQGIIKMFAMSKADDRIAAISELNIVPVSISYEWEPCDLLKAVELYKRMNGPYVKQKGEDLNSILTGLLQPKGHIHMHLCPKITEAELLPFSGLSANEYYKKVANLVDSRICGAYRLYPNNFIAHDLRSGRDEYSKEYTRQQRMDFLAHISAARRYSPECDAQCLRDILLDIYANPVDSKNLF